jgi:hypothetical protein
VAGVGRAAGEDLLPLTGSARSRVSLATSSTTTFRILGSADATATGLQRGWEKGGGREHHSDDICRATERREHPYARSSSTVGSKSARSCRADSGSVAVGIGLVGHGAARRCARDEDATTFQSTPPRRFRSSPPRASGDDEPDDPPAPSRNGSYGLPRRAVAARPSVGTSRRSLLRLWTLISNPARAPLARPTCASPIPARPPGSSP